MTRVAKVKHKTVSGIVIPPQVFSGNVSGEEISGDIFKSVLFAGTITKCFVQLDKKPKKPVRLDIKILNELTGTTKTFYLEKIKDSILLDENILDGSFVTLSIQPTGEEDKIKEVWFSFLWISDISNIKRDIEKISKLDKIEE